MSNARGADRVDDYTHGNLHVGVVQYLLVHQDTSKETQSRSTVARSVPI